MLCAGVLQFPDLVQCHQALFSLAALRVDLGRRWTAAKDTGMKFDPRQIITLGAAGIATIILSAAVTVGLLYSLW